MLTIVFLVAGIWLGIIGIVLAVCVSAARGDRSAPLPAPPVRAARARLRLIA